MNDNEVINSSSDSSNAWIKLTLYKPNKEGDKFYSFTLTIPGTPNGGKSSLLALSALAEVAANAEELGLNLFRPEVKIETAGPAPLSDSGSSNDEPHYEPLPEEEHAVEYKKYSVESVEHAVTQKGKDCVKVKNSSAWFSDYGLTAMVWTLPSDVKKAFKDWQIGKAFEPPKSMRFVVTEKKGGKEYVHHFESE